jgi:hypothetical protein
MPTPEPPFSSPPPAGDKDDGDTWSDDELGAITTTRRLLLQSAEEEEEGGGALREAELTSPFGAICLAVTVATSKWRPEAAAAKYRAWWAALAEFGVAAPSAVVVAGAAEPGLLAWRDAAAVEPLLRSWATVSS